MRGIKDWPKGTKSSSGKATGGILWAAIGLLGLPICVLLGVVAGLLHGYGVI